MDHANRGIIERQVANPVGFCAFCLGNGLQCAACHKLFVVGDLRVEVTGAPSGQKIHFFCLDLFSEDEIKPVPVSCDSLCFHEVPPCESDDQLLAKAGQIVAQEITRHLPGYADDNSTSSFLTRILASGYLAYFQPHGTGLNTHYDHPGSIASEVCDFCGVSKPSGSAPVATFALPNVSAPGEIPLVYEGAWAHCDECAPLVSRRDHVALAKRAMNKMSITALPPDRRSRRFETLYGVVMTKMISTTKTTPEGTQ